MFGDYKESIKILERQKLCYQTQLKHRAWWERGERQRIGAAISALSIVIMALESAWHAEEEEFSRQYALAVSGGAGNLPYDVVALYKRELVNKGGKRDA